MTMKWNQGRKSSLVSACLGLLLAVGCLDYDPVDKQSYEAPLLTGQSSAQTVVDLRGNIDFGQTVTDSFSETRPLTGYMFDALQGARVTVTLKVNNGEDPVLILYGPVNDKGLWGQPIHVDDDGLDGLNSLINDLELSRPGRYLLAAATYSGVRGGGFELSLGCRGACGEPHCPDVLCDLYCSNGFMRDSDGCPICRCAEAECASDADCPLLPWTDEAARCIDGLCVYEHAGMECNDDLPCPEGYACAMACGCMVGPDGEEQCDCFGECVYIGHPECVEGDVCQTETGANGFCVQGRCVPFSQECSADGDCPPGFACIEICAGVVGCGPDDPDCRPCDPALDPTCAEVACEHLCMPVEPPSCNSNADCPAGHVCVMECYECADGDPDCVERCVGFCVPDSQPTCASDADCVFPGGYGTCLEGRCVFDEIACQADSDCPPDMFCAMACWDCDPEDPTCEPGCDGYCVPQHQPQCFSDYDCIDEAGQLGRCVDGFCVFEPLFCASNADCPAGFLCELRECWDDCPTGAPDCCFGVCMPDGAPQCRSDEECMSADGTFGRCVNGRCVYDTCACPAIWAPVCAEFCVSEEGYCQQMTFPNACEADCAGAWILYWGACEDDPMACANDADCPAGTYCAPDASGDFGVCQPLPGMECMADGDCPEGFRCEPGLCPGMPCIEGEPCPPCWGQCVPSQAECIVTGCSGEICAPYPVSSTCIWLPEYECLQFSSCEALTTSDGQMTCGWTQTAAYLECLAGVSNSGVCSHDADCAPAEFCMWVCDAAGECQGQCRPADCVCPEYYDPVCGLDGQTYDNICFLNCAGVGMSHSGSCERGPEAP